MRKINYGGSVLTIFMFMCINGSIFSNMIGENERKKEIFCETGKISSSKTDVRDIKNMMPNKNKAVALTMNFEGIYPRAVILINNDRQGTTDENGDQSFDFNRNVEVGRNKLLIKIHNSVIQRCEFEIQQSSKLECTGTDDFKCILIERNIN